MIFSVVTPSYRQLSWLEKAIFSIRDQVPVQGGSLVVEHLVQDAGTPGIDEFSKGHSHCGENYRLHIFSERDQGMYDAVNRGLKKVGGEICSYLNCDEQYLEGTLSKVIEFFAKNPEVEVVFGDAILVDTKGKALSYRRAVLPDRLHTRRVHLNVLTCATFFRRSIIDRGFLFDPRWKIIGDAAWIDSMLEAGVPMAVMHEPLSVFTFTGTNLSEEGRSVAEQLTWVPSSGILGKFLRTFAIVRHRWQKWVAGSYQYRDLSYRIYTGDNCQKRAVFQETKVGWSWPKNQG